MKEVKETKKWGRGIDFYFLITPKLKNEDKDNLLKALIEIPEYKDNFSGNRVKIKESDEENTEYIRMATFRGRFKLKEEEYYTIYIQFFSIIFSNVMQVLDRFDYKIVGYYYGMVWLSPEPWGMMPFLSDFHIPMYIVEPFQKKIEENRRILGMPLINPEKLERI